MNTVIRRADSDLLQSAMRTGACRYAWMRGGALQVSWDYSDRHEQAPVVGLIDLSDLTDDEFTAVAPRIAQRLYTRLAAQDRRAVLEATVRELLTDDTSHGPRCVRIGGHGYPVVCHTGGLAIPHLSPCDPADVAWIVAGLADRAEKFSESA